MRRQRTIACLGFSANPPHEGHLDLAKFVLRRGGVDEVWLIPCARHRFKRDLLPEKHRWEMTKLMERSKIKACDIELQRGGISYTIDTIRELKRRYPAYTFLWIIGSDIVVDRSYRRWYQWSQLLRLTKFLVVERPGFPFHVKVRLPKCFRILKGGPELKLRRRISSTYIRNRLKKNLPINGFVTKKVEKYLGKMKSVTVSMRK